MQTPLQITLYRFRFTALDPLRLPPYPGSALRGVFGHGLRKTACVTRQPRCDGCMLLDRCPYIDLFDTRNRPPGHGARVFGQDAPHPLVLDVSNTPNQQAPGAPFTVQMNLIGQARNQLPYLIQAWSEAATGGLGPQRARFALQGADYAAPAAAPHWQSCYEHQHPRIQAPADTEAPVPPCPQGPIGLRLTTPLRSKQQGKLIGRREFTAQHLLRPLLKRLEQLRAFHDPEQPPLDVPALLQQAEDIRANHLDLRWHDWQRLSNRQQSRMQLGGLIGRIQLSGQPLQDLWPLLWIGQWTHVGKSTSFGLGRYRIETDQDTTA